MHNDIATTNSTLDLRYLQSELARLDIRLRRQLRLWERAGQDPADPYRGLYVTAETANSLLVRPLGSHWGGNVTLAAEEEAVLAQAQAAAADHSRALAAEAHAAGCRLRLERLQTAFGLDATDRDILLLGLAPAIDLRYERVFAFLQDDITRKLPSLNLALDLLAPPGVERLRLLRRFDDSAPLLRHGLLRRVAAEGAGHASPLASAFLCDETVAAWLAGSYRLPADLAGCLRLWSGEQPAAALPLDDELCAGLQRVLHAATPPLVILAGPDALAQAAAAQWLARAAGQPLLVFDAAALPLAQAPLPALRRTLRDARLLDAVLHLHGGEALADDGALAAALAELLDNHPGLVLIGAQEPWRWPGPQRSKRMVRFTFPVPTAPARAALWHHFLAAHVDSRAGASALPAVETVAERYALTSAQVRDAAAAALDMAAQAGAPLAAAHLQLAARAQSAANFHGLARKVEPRYRWADLILPDEQLDLLQEIVAAVRYRSFVSDEWGAGRKLAASAGLAVLFSGPPGTGKTMAAEVVAGELGLDLYKVDLSAIVSKYIGETEKNLERIFTAAEQSAGILFFDEADALFGKRSDVRDAHDRYANIEVSYVLQRIETYNGVAILASNLRGNLDAAFTRRFFATVDFPVPNQRQRLRLWHTLLPPQTPRCDNINFGLLAEHYELAGSEIRNVLLCAMYLAASTNEILAAKHIASGLQREAQKAAKFLPKPAEWLLIAERGTDDE